MTTDELVFGIESATEDITTKMEYKGYQIFFRGWVCSPNSDVLIGAWLAWKSNSIQDPQHCYNFAVSVPGGYAMFYRRGESFNIAQHTVTNQIFVQADEADKYQQTRQLVIRALDELKLLINQVVKA